MNLRAVAIVLAIAAVAGFTLLNWAAITAPTTLSLGFTAVQAPLGVVMLAISAALCALFVVYLLFQQAGALLEARRYAKEMAVQRELADRAEASRLIEMRTALEAEIRRLEVQATAAAQATDARIDRLEHALQERIDESTRTLSAYVGEVEDKLDRLLPRLPG